MRLLSLVVLATIAASPTLAADPIEGEWVVEDGSAKARILPCESRAERLCGSVSWVRDPRQATATDANNPDPRLRSRPIKGLPILSDFRQTDRNRWRGGKIYDPKTGRSYDARLDLKADDALKVEGCVLMVCRGEVWRRP